MGDFNLNLLNHQIHDATGQFLDGLHSCMFSPLITLPSRITSHSATLIDNIFTNYLEHHYRTAGLLLADISDHLPIFSICSDDISSLRSKENIFVRNKNEANTLNFLQQLKVPIGHKYLDTMIQKSDFLRFTIYVFRSKN